MSSRVLLVGTRDWAAGAAPGFELHSCSGEEFLKVLPAADGRYTAGGHALVLVADPEVCQHPLRAFALAFELLGDRGYLLFLLPRRGGVASPLRAWRELPRQTGFSASPVADLNGGREACLYRRVATPGTRITHTDLVSRAALLELFERSFGHPLSERLWAWKYAGGRGEGAVLVDDEGRLLGHYGGVERRISYFGEPGLMMQVGDVMVAPGQRGILKKHGAFYRLMTAYGESQAGDHSHRLTGFGFPNGRHMRLAEKLGIYADVGGLVQVSWPPPKTSGSANPGGSRWHRLDEVSGREAAPLLRLVERLWRVMRRDFSGFITGIRDAAFFRHRYLEHPEIPYRVWRFRHRLTRRIRGLVVTRRHQDSVEVMDLLGGRADFPLLVAAARRACAPQLPLFMWMPEAFAAELAGPDGMVQALDIRIPTNTCVPGPDPARLRDRWWLTAGDTDFR